MIITSCVVSSSLDFLQQPVCRVFALENLTLSDSGIGKGGKYIQHWVPRPLPTWDRLSVLFFGSFQGT